MAVVIRNLIAFLLAFAGIVAVVVLVVVPRLGGGSDGSTLKIALKDDYGAVIGGALLGAGGSGIDELNGSLAPTGNGTWRGTVVGSTNQTIETSVLSDNCKTTVSGIQGVEVVATRGNFGQDLNLRLQLSPVSPPDYTKPDTCTTLPPPKAPNGIEWLRFHFEAYRGEGIYVHLPDKPGGTWTHDFHAVTEGPNYCEALAPLAGCSRVITLTVEYR
jgi:hypothetical protein